MIMKYSVYPMKDLICVSLNIYLNINIALQDSPSYVH